MRISTPTQKCAFSGDDNLVPLINIIFLLLIFFMVAGRITVSDAVPVEAPESTTQTPQAEADVIMLVSATGDVFVESESVGIDALIGLLQERLAQSSDPDAFRIQVKVDAALPVEDLKTVLGSVRSAGVLAVSLLTRERVLP